MPFMPREVIVKLKRAGFEEVRQTGSHLFLRHPDGRLTFVAIHRADISMGTMRKILKQANFTEDQFKELYISFRAIRGVFRHRRPRLAGCRAGIGAPVDADRNGRFLVSHDQSMAG
jgi:predicted RNA binding protein YcfA (HicA-like mRNA interferase family)